ncbi:hypothetical protein B0H14DRAFT_3528307 [Mycena olivaceomarginata]|nr:hypothetical protein B0H14DRAFT_3528307 [Mycena olivaceomarginata]
MFPSLNPTTLQLFNLPGDTASFAPVVKPHSCALTAHALARIAHTTVLAALTLVAHTRARARYPHPRARYSPPSCSLPATPLLAVRHRPSPCSPSAAHRPSARHPPTLRSLPAALGVRCLPPSCSPPAPLFSLAAALTLVASRPPAFAARCPLPLRSLPTALMLIARTFMLPSRSLPAPRASFHVHACCWPPHSGVISVSIQDVPVVASLPSDLVLGVDWFQFLLVIDDLGGSLVVSHALASRRHGCGAVAGVPPPSVPG